jgi:hypothetical protein
MLQKAGVDYVAAGRSIEFVAGATPQPGDVLLASYRLSGGGEDGTAQIYPSSQVLCNGVGAATNALEFASIGTCSIAAGVLGAGDRVDIRFDLERQGSAGGFTFELVWGSTTVVRREAGSGDLLVAGRADAAILAAGAQLTAQSWGTVLPFGAAVASAPDSYAGGLTLEVRGKVAAAGDSVAVKGFTVVRLP